MCANKLLDLCVCVERDPLSDLNRWAHSLRGGYEGCRTCPPTSRPPSPISFCVGEREREQAIHSFSLNYSFIPPCFIFSFFFWPSSLLYSLFFPEYHSLALRLLDNSQLYFLMNPPSFSSLNHNTPVFVW